MASLPQYLMGIQGQIDFEPINQGLGRYFQRQQMEQDRAMQNERLGMEHRRLGFEEQRMARDAAQDPIHMKLLEQKLAQGTAALGLNSLQRQRMEAEIKLTQAQARAADQKDAFDQLILRQFGGEPAPAAAPPAVRPQSFAPPADRPAIMQPVVDEMSADPNLIRTQSAPTQPGAAPQQPGGDPVVQTPMGPMPSSQAKRLGFMMAMRGKGDAGRMLVDSADTTKLGKDVRGDVDKAEFKATDLMGRMKAIKEGFRPEFLTFEEQAKQFGVSFADKFDALRSKLPPDVIQRHADYTAFRRDTVENLNRYIQEVTGAAMGVEEAKRLSKAVPTMDDGPTAFKAKMDGVVKQTQLAIARYRHLRAEGFNGQPWSGTAEDAARDLPLDRMGGIIRDQSKAVLQQLRQQNPSATDEQLRGATRAVIRKKFGIDA